MISSLFPHSVAAAKWLAVGIVALGLMYLGHYVGEAVEPDRAPAPPDTVRKEREATIGDLPDATLPDMLTKFEPPDTSDTYRTCFQVPRWIAEEQDRSQQRLSTRADSQKSADASRTTTVRLHTPRTESELSGGPGYGIIPMTSGRPTVSVGSDLVQVPVFGAQGALTTYEYDIPKDRWALFPELSARTTPIGVEATAAVGLRWKDWTLTVGYAAMAGERGVTVGLRWRPFKADW